LEPSVILVLLLLLIVAVILASPIRSRLRIYRGEQTVRAIGAQLSEAQTLAMNEFTRTRFSVDISANVCQSEAYNKAAGAWNFICRPRPLGRGASFGYGSIAAPAGSQTTLQQTSAVMFNPRGIPVDETGSPTGECAIYVHSRGQYFAVTVSVAGVVRLWKHDGSSWQPL